MPNEVKLLPCETCGAKSPDDNEFCSDGFHAKGPLYWPCEHCGGTGNAHSRPTTVVTDEVVERVKRLDEYDPESLPEHLRWKGEGPPPASWYVGGTKVYRSYADYCDD